MNRDSALEKSKDAAYQKGQDWGYSNKSFTGADQLGYEPASVEFDAFLAGYEDGQAMKESEINS